MTNITYSKVFYFVQSEFRAACELVYSASARGTYKRVINISQGVHSTGSTASNDARDYQAPNASAAKFITA